jgi:hypothetical protein
MMCDPQQETEMVKEILVLLGLATSPPVEWEHGYKTDYVIATRYANPSMGYNIGFDLPKNCNDADRADMYDWLSAHGVHVFQGGGAPCATNYAKIEGVTNKDEANSFLVKFLPEFDAWVRANLH